MEDSNQKISYSQMNRILFEKYQNGNLSVRNEIIENNLIIVKRIAETYSQRSGMSYEDLFQEGCCALISAVDKYDVSLGNDFMHYASLFIMRHITNYIKSNKYLIHVPMKLITNIVTYDRFKDCNLNDTEIREKMGMNKEKFNNFLKDYNIIKYTEFIDLKKKVNKNEENLIVEDIIAGDESIDVVIDNISKTELRTKLKELLTERELQIIYMRFGFDCDKMSRSEIGKIFKVTEPRIEQIEHKALVKLRRYNRTVMERFYI